MYGLQMVHVPYKGNVAGLIACTTCEVDFGTFAVAPAIAMVQAEFIHRGPALARPAHVLSLLAADQALLRWERRLGYCVPQVTQM